MDHSIVEEERKLFNEWADRRKGFSPDGIIDEESYLTSCPKILFIMKEVNSDQGFDLKEFIRNGGRSQTYNNMARWVYGIRHIENDVAWSFLEKIDSEDARAELLKSICVVNLKKSPGGHTTNNNELWSVSVEDKEFINAQINIYFKSKVSCPNIIIACGSAASNTFNELVDIEKSTEFRMTTHGIWYYKFNDNDIFIKYSHPEARVQDCLLYYGLMDAIKEVSNG